MFERGKSKSGEDDSTHHDYHSDRDAGRHDTPRPASAAQRGEVAVIGHSIRINGDLQGDEDLRIEGDVTGTVELKNNTLTIGAEGKIRANVYAKSVTVDGLVEGDLYGSERVSIRKNAHVHGNITAPRVSLEDGARFKGSIEMDTEDMSSNARGNNRKASPAEETKTLKPVSSSGSSDSASSTGGGSAAKAKTASGK